MENLLRVSAWNAVQEKKEKEVTVSHKDLKFSGYDLYIIQRTNQNRIPKISRNQKLSQNLFVVRISHKFLRFISGMVGMGILASTTILRQDGINHNLCSTTLMDVSLLDVGSVDHDF